MTIRLGDITEVTAGQAAPKEFANEGTPFIRAGHLEKLISGNNLKSLPKVSKNVATKRRLKKTPAGSVLFAKSGMSATKNRVYITEEDSYIVSHIAAIIPNEKFDSPYLGRFLSWYNPSKLILDSAYPSIRLTDIKNLQIPLPDLKTQKKIASILDDAQALKQKTEQLLKEYDELAQSIFLDMFGDPVTNPKGWEKVKFNNLFKQGKKIIKPEDIESGQKYIGLEHIEKTTGKILEYVKLKKGEIKSNKFWFNQNYVLYGKLRPYLNKVATPEFEGICSTDIIPFKPIESKSNRAYLTNLMRGEWFVEYANRRTSGANLPRISPKEINNFQTINPPIHHQNQFAEKIALIEQQKDLAKQELQESEDLFQALLQKAFKGELI